MYDLNSKADMRNASMALPNHATYIPYELRTEMNWVDFSSPINPLGTPKSFIQAVHSSIVDGELAYGPDRDAESFSTAMARYFGLSRDSFLCGASVSEMIQAAAQAYQSCTVGISVPSPIEYSLAISNAGHELIELACLDSFVAPTVHSVKRSGIQFDAVVLANPSYPTSRLLSEKTLLDYLEICKWVIVDESLIELTLGGASMIHLTKTFRNLIIIRSFSNTFATPGTPISYAIAHPDTIAQMQLFFDTSSISMFAEIFARLIHSQDDYLEETRDLLESEIPWMQCMLNLIPGIVIFPAEASYVMCAFHRSNNLELAVSSADELIMRLQLAGFLVKKLEGMPGINSGKYFCIAVKTREENEKLLHSIQKIIQIQN